MESELIRIRESQGFHFWVCTECPCAFGPLVASPKDAEALAAEHVREDHSVAAWPSSGGV